MHVSLCSAKQYLYFIWLVSLGTLCRMCYGMEIATYILCRPIREVSRSVAIGTSLQYRVSLFEKGAEYRSYKQAVCAREFRQKFPYAPVPNVATQKRSNKLKRFDQQLQFQTVRESADYKLRTRTLLSVTWHPIACFLYHIFIPYNFRNISTTSFHSSLRIL